VWFEDTWRSITERLVSGPALVPVAVRSAGTGAGRRVSSAVTVSRRFVGDRRGAAAVQMMVMLPVILLAFVAGVKLWQIMMIRRSLNTGTYLATRYLSLYPPTSTFDQEWSAIARRFVWAELMNNPYVDQARMNDVFVPVSVTLTDGSNECTSQFTVVAEYTFFGPAGTPGDLGLPQMSQFTLTEERRGEVLCD
jgi:Flp pilus assembly protein TadG